MDGWVGWDGIGLAGFSLSLLEALQLPPDWSHSRSHLNTHRVHLVLYKEEAPRNFTRAAPRSGQGLVPRPFCPLQEGKPEAKISQSGVWPESGPQLGLARVSSYVFLEKQVIS